MIESNKDTPCNIIVSKLGQQVTVSVFDSYWVPTYFRPVLN